MGPLLALTALLSAVLLEPASAECTFEFVPQWVPHYNRKLQHVSHDLGTLDDVVSTDCPDERGHGPQICFDQDFEAIFGQDDWDELTEVFSRADYLDDPKSWGNYVESLLIWFLSCINIAVITVFCLWPGCLCFCCCAHRCSPSGRWKTREKFQTCLLVGFMVLVALLVFMGHLGNIGVTRGQLLIVEKPMSTLTKMMKSLPQTSAKFGLDLVGRTWVQFFKEGNATLHEYVRPDQLLQSLHCAHDGLKIATEVVDSLTDIVEDVKAATATLPSKDNQDLGKLTWAVAAVRANVSGLHVALGSLTLARPVLLKQISTTIEASQKMGSDIQELRNALTEARSSGGAVSDLRGESVSFDVDKASADEKEAHVRRLKVYLKKVPNTHELAKTITTLNSCLDKTSKSVGVFTGEWEALNSTACGESGPLKDMPSMAVLSDSLDSVDEGLDVLGLIDTRSVTQVIAKLQEADVAKFATQAQQLKDNVNCTLEAKVCLKSAAEFLGDHWLAKSVKHVKVLLDGMEEHMGGELPDFNELSERLAEVCGPSVFTPEVKLFLEQADDLEKEVAVVRKEFDSADWDEIFTFGHEREAICSKRTIGNRMAKVEESLSTPKLRLEVSQVEDFDLAGLDKALELMLQHRNFDQLPKLHEQIETQLPNTTDFRLQAMRARIRLNQFLLTVDKQAESLRQAIEGIPDTKDATEGLKTLEAAVSKIPDPGVFSDSVGKLLTGVSYLKQHTEDMAKMVIGVGKAVKDIPNEEVRDLTRFIENMIRYTGSHETEKGSLAWMLNELSVASLQRTMDEEGLAKLIEKVFATLKTSLEFAYLPHKIPDQVLKPRVVMAIDALEDRPMRRGGKPSDNGALWYFVNAMAYAQIPSVHPSYWLKPQEAFAPLGENALVAGYLDEGKFRKYNGDDHMIYCLTKDCLENTVRLINKGDAFSLITQPGPEEAAVIQWLPKSREMVTAMCFIWPLVLVFLSGLVLATRAKCLSCCFLFSTLIYLPVLMVIMAYLVPIVTLGADVCGSTGSLSVRTMTIVAPEVCNSMEGGIFEHKTRLCHLGRLNGDINQTRLKFNMEEVMRSIVDRCDGRSKPGVEAVHDFWEEAATAMKAGMESELKWDGFQLGPPAETLVRNLMGNATNDVKSAVLKLGKTVDCEALNDIYSDIKDSLCCQIGGHIYIFVFAGYLIGMCIIYCAIPGGAIGMMSKVEPPRRETQLVGPDGRMYVDNRDMVEMGRL